MYEEQSYSQSNTLQSKARNNFVVKVYSIVALQLLVTGSFVCLNMFFHKFARFQAQHFGLFYVCLIVSIITLLVLSFSRELSKKFPTNIALLGLFTICQSYMVSMITNFYTPESVLLSAVATLAATLGITLYAITTKTDFTSMLHSFYAGISAFIWILLSVSILNIFLRSSFISMGMAVIFGGIYTVYLLIDTQLVLGGKKHEISLDNYVMGAVIIYMDIIRLFLKLLQLLGDKKKKD